MGGEVIKEFLVGLGFDVDASSLGKFTKAIASASLRVTALFASVQTSAAGIFYGISKISEGFETMGYELRLVNPAVNKFLILKQAMLQAYKRAGVDLVKVVRESILFNLSLAKTKYAIEAIYKSVAAKFFPVLTKQMDIFRLKIYANMPKIQEALKKFVDFIFKAFKATIQLGTTVWSILGRVWDFFAQLDKATGGWSTKILAAAAAWKILNLEFLATPLGLLLSGLLAILALYDDFKVWEEGGKSFFDWSSFLPVIHEMGDAISDVGDVLGDLFRVVLDVKDAIVELFELDFTHFKFTMQTIFGESAEYLTHIMQLFKDLRSAGSGLVNWGTNVLGGANAAPTLNSATQPKPLLPQSNMSNQKVSQETNILVQGSADANSVGKAVASQQDKVNFDMVRNLKPAMR